MIGVDKADAEGVENEVAVAEISDVGSGISLVKSGCVVTCPSVSSVETTVPVSGSIEFSKL